ncbi:MAG: glycosyltransferase family 2 protein [Candidatus Binataceae bacterium]
MDCEYQQVQWSFVTMKLVFMVAVFWLAYIYAGYPIILALLGLTKRVRPVNDENEPRIPSVSVLIAARNEEQDIGWKIAETLAWDYPPEKLHITVASDASEDSTDEIIRGFSDARVTLVRMDRRGGKARALNRLAELSKSQILFFTDANAHIAPQVLRLMVRHFADSRVGCVTGDSQSIEETDSPAVSRGASVYWSYETILKRLENRIGSVLVCDGAIFCMRAELYQPVSVNLANDLEIPMRVGTAGYLVTHEPEAIVFERDTASPLEEFNRRRRMCAQGMLAVFTLRGALRGVRGWQFISHKLLRWLSLIPMLMILMSSAVLAENSGFFLCVLALEGIFFGLAGWALVLTAFRRSVPAPLAIPFYVVLGVVGALVGIGESLLGRRFDVWDIPKMSRGPAPKVSSTTTTQEV